MILKKLLWAFKRHPFLYISRFKLLSKNSRLEEISGCNYNSHNPKKQIPDYFKRINQDIFPKGRQESDLETVLQLSRWLKEHIPGGPGLSEPSDTALNTMLSGRGGVCSDMAQIFNNFCVINDILVREWGTTSAPFDKKFGGHSFNEVYISQLKKWVLIDASYNIVFYGKQSQQPLSVIDMYQLKRAGQDIQFKTFNDGIKEVDKQIINKNYLNDRVTPFLICNYKNKTYDAFLRFSGGAVPVFMTHFAIYLLGKSYHYKFPLDDYRNIFN